MTQLQYRLAPAHALSITSAIHLSVHTHIAIHAHTHTSKSIRQSSHPYPYIQTSHPLRRCRRSSPNPQPPQNLLISLFFFFFCPLEPTLQPKPIINHIVCAQPPTLPTLLPWSLREQEKDPFPFPLCSGYLSSHYLPPAASVPLISVSLNAGQCSFCFVCCCFCKSRVLLAIAPFAVPLSPRSRPPFIYLFIHTWPIYFFSTSKFQRWSLPRSDVTTLLQKYPQAPDTHRIITRVYYISLSAFRFQHLDRHS